MWLVFPVLLRRWVVARATVNPRALPAAGPPASLRDSQKFAKRTLAKSWEVSCDMEIHQTKVVHHLMKIMFLLVGTYGTPQYSRTIETQDTRALMKHLGHKPSARQKRKDTKLSATTIETLSSNRSTRINRHFSNAEYWSQQHLGVSTEEEITEGAVAVLVTGQLRFENEAHVGLFRRALQDTDVYVVTYPSFRTLGHRLSNNVLLVDPKPHEDAVGEDTSLWQWLLLAQGLIRWKSVLLKTSAYHTLVRARTDLVLPPEFTFGQCRSRL